MNILLNNINFNSLTDCHLNVLVKRYEFTVTLQANSVNGVWLLSSGYDCEVKGEKQTK